MRENIGLFKAKRLDNGEEVQGHYWTNRVGNHFITVVENKAGHFISPVDDEIDPETLCECIGKKDDNDNLIFEHDRLKDNKGQVGTVFYANCRYAVNWCGVDGEYFTDDCFCGKVIGNKFDNPELLEKEDEK